MTIKSLLLTFYFLSTTMVMMLFFFLLSSFRIWVQVCFVVVFEDLTELFIWSWAFFDIHPESCYNFLNLFFVKGILFRELDFEIDNQISVGHGISVEGHS